MDGRVARISRTGALLAIASCATPRIASSSAELESRLPFLRAGDTTLEETLERLGEPAFRHDAERTMIWVAGREPDGKLRTVQTTRERIVRAGGEERIATEATWSRELVEIVLQFDASGTLVRGSLVRAE